MVSENLDQLMEYKIRSKLELLNTIPIYKMIEPEFYECLENKLVIKFPVLPWELNHMGSLHGGVIAVFLDFTFGLLTSHLCSSFKIPTVNLNINYLSGAYISDELYVEAIADKVGRNFVNLSGRIYTAAESEKIINVKNIATSTSSFFVLDQEKGK